MSKQVIYKLSKNEEKRQKLEAMAASSLLIPLRRLQEEKDTKPMLTASESLFFAWAISDAVAGRVASAADEFELRLLPTSVQHGFIWRGCVLLWCAILRIYLCDPARTLEYVEDAEVEGISDKIPEFQMLKGMAYRLQGKFTEAIELLRKSSSRTSELYPDEQALAVAWLLESSVAGGYCRPNTRQIQWLDERDVYLSHGTVGALLAATYRLTVVSGLSTPSGRHPEDILTMLDKTAVFERPLLTMLLEDILPRPLEGVEIVSVLSDD